MRHAKLQERDAGESKERQEERPETERSKRPDDRVHALRVDVDAEAIRARVAGVSPLAAVSIAQLERGAENDAPEHECAYEYIQHDPDRAHTRA